MNRGQFVAVLIGGLALLGLGAAFLDRPDGEPTPVELTAASTQDATDAESSSTTETTEAAREEPLPVDAPANHGPAGTLTNLDGWLQTSAGSLEDFDGQVKIIQFWTFGCYNCTNTIPHLQEIYAEHQPDGLEIIGVHAPEFSYEEDPDAVAAAAVELGVTWPIALDTSKTNFRQWQSPRRFWPRTYVVDANGDIRFDHIGEGSYDELEATVAYLLANGGA